MNVDTDSKNIMIVIDENYKAKIGSERCNKSTFS